MKSATRSLLSAIVASIILSLVFASQNEPMPEPRAIQIRADPVAHGSAESTSAVALTSQVPTSATSASTTQAAATTSSPSPSPSSSSSAAVKPGASSPVVSTNPATSAGSALVSSVVTSAVATTNAAGQVVTSVIQYTPTPSSSAPSSTQASNNQSSGDSGGLGTGSIIGLSVSGGIAAIAIILFFVWKFTRKRFADFDDNEAIKWPELNAHNNDVHALPTNSTGGAGFGAENDSDVNLTRAPSPGAYANSIAASSVPEMYGAADPYAVPPLPHLNPNQPYRDDPGAYGQPASYYDPYRGPVPNAFADGAESIPMTQMARMRSPAPQMAHDMQGRASPAPQAAMGYAGADERSRTPNPAALTGRASPSPHSAYGYGPR